MYNPLKYIPSIPLAAVATALYALTALALAFGLRKWGQKWMLTVRIRALTVFFIYERSTGAKEWRRERPTCAHGVRRKWAACMQPAGVATLGGG